MFILYYNPSTLKEIVLDIKKVILKFRSESLKDKSFKLGFVPFQSKTEILVLTPKPAQFPRKEWS